MVFKILLVGICKVSVLLDIVKESFGKNNVIVHEMAVDYFNSDLYLIQGKKNLNEESILVLVNGVDVRNKI